jgi:sugar diacid utilization regulator
VTWASARSPGPSVEAPERSHDSGETSAGLPLREQLSRLQGLLVLSMLMTESGDVGHTLHLATTAVPSLGACRLAGVYLTDGGWQDTVSGALAPAARADLQAQFAVLNSAGGSVAIVKRAWVWAYPLRSLAGQFGYLVIEADDEPDDAVQFLLRVLAQQTGIALSNSRLHANERASAAKLRETNAALARTVAALERSRAIHDRLNGGALAGEGIEGIVRAVHELTGLGVSVEDRHGNVRAQAGPYDSAEPGRRPPAQQEKLLAEAEGSGRPVRDGERWVVVTRPRPDVIGVLALNDPGGEGGEEEQIALSHGATLLGMELTRLQSIMETEFRLGRDLVDELLAGTDESEAIAAALALGFDVDQPHCVVLVEAPEPDSGGDELFQAVRRAARAADAGSLLAPRGRGVVVIARTGVSFGRLRAALLDELPGVHCGVGVGGACDRLSDFPRSLREAQLALRMQEMQGVTDAVTRYAQLGVLRLFAALEDVSSVDRVIREWLGPLLDYDEVRHSDLVATLAGYFDHGRNHDATARALSIHRSTLKYRLQRIEQISGHDLAEPDAGFNLELALRSWQTLRALRS